MNSCNFIGRLTKDPEAKSTANGKVFCNFSIAVDRGYKDSQGNKLVDFIPCTAWEATSNLITKYFHKGDLIGINGRLESRAYEDNGAKKTSYSVLVNNIDFIQGKNETKEPKPQEEPVTPTEDPIEDGVPFEI
jgi:single-strand DNA-binding protein